MRPIFFEAGKRKAATNSVHFFVRRGIQPLADLDMKSGPGKLESEEGSFGCMGIGRASR